jgi:hypothetical protein
MKKIEDTPNFKILKEQVSEIDLSSNNSHKRMAETLKNLIKDNDNLTVGLEGEFGSGKSTVLSFLNKELIEDSDKFLTFYFDIWSHESDQLRKHFLLKFLEQIKFKDDRLDEVASELKNKVTKNHKEVKRSTTTLGFWMAIFTFIFPVGITLVSQSGPFCYGLECGGISFWGLIFHLMAFSPILFLLIIGPFIIAHQNKEEHKKWNKDFFKLSKWSFFQSSNEEHITEITTGLRENSSVEFEEYFEKLLNVIREKYPEAKIILIIDNLDRVDRDQIISIFKTLQIFIQNRNTLELNSSRFDNLHVIIPYNSGGLSYFTEEIMKYFEVILTVPSPLPSSWSAIVDELYKQNFEGWSNAEKDRIINVFKYMVKNTHNVPRIRDVKFYLNQVRVLHNHTQGYIHTEVIAYYIYLLYLNGINRYKLNLELVKPQINIKRGNNNELTNRQKIIYGIIEGTIPSQEDLSYFDLDEFTQQLAAVIFDVSNNEGFEALIQGHLKSLLNQVELDSKPNIQKIEENFKESFWTIFNLVITNDSSSEFLIKTSYNIYRAFGNQDRNLDRLKNLLNRLNWINTSSIYFDKNLVEKKVHLQGMELMSLNTRQKYFEHLVQSFGINVLNKVEIQSKDFRESKQIKSYLQEIFTYYDDLIIVEEDWRLENWIALVDDEEEFVNGNFFVQVSSKRLNRLKEEIKNSGGITSSILKILRLINQPEMEINKEFNLELLIHFLQYSLPKKNQVDSIYLDKYLLDLVLQDLMHLSDEKADHLFAIIVKHTNYFINSQESLNYYAYAQSFIFYLNGVQKNIIETSLMNKFFQDSSQQKIEFYKTEILGNKYYKVKHNQNWLLKLLSNSKFNLVKELIDYHLNELGNLNLDIKSDERSISLYIKAIHHYCLMENDDSNCKIFIEKILQSKNFQEGYKDYDRKLHNYELLEGLKEKYFIKV